ncbi:hypothetical protein OV207_33525 [Corallococcus sp. BB11-1]|uniref:hypothetical protein n=1 Tax=Corallococcus sp. BB11-1 TaxID=2996783 RepID=UPI00226FEC2E|nr:hypothetical protein [Corallococcus sp. BB11-1]MCY1036406.1 hypothetical protein [Corallococcus sp. BB11-1]
MGTEPYRYLEAIKQVKAGNLEEAQRLVEEASKQGHASVEELLAMAFAMDEKKQRPLATSLLEEALKRQPSAVEPACVLAMFHLENQEDAEAARILTPALAASPDHPKANLCMAMALAKTETERARTFAAKAMKDPDADIRQQAEALDKSLSEHAPR